LNNKKKTKIRIDDLLVKRGLAEDKKQAQALVFAGKVHSPDRVFANPSQLVLESSLVFSKHKSSYVGRGGLKLENALAKLGIKGLIADKNILDIGCSTGGFTQCLLAHKAQKVVAVDVGSNQLAWEVRKDKRVIALEKTNISEFDPQGLPQIDFITADISFNSLVRLAPAIVKALGQGSYLLLLVKPQFELASWDIPKGGVVLDEKLQQKAIAEVSKAMVDLGFVVISSCKSIPKGTSGNQEFFVFLKKK
jgi:23S rRNA (cytidine1920-2'-O)/16S rRNA (cytidine1409-2'-O)-methyltransferase